MHCLPLANATSGFCSKCLYSVNYSIKCSCCWRFLLLLCHTSNAHILLASSFSKVCLFIFGTGVKYISNSGGLSFPDSASLMVTTKPVNTSALLSTLTSFTTACFGMPHPMSSSSPPAFSEWLAYNSLMLCLRKDWYVLYRALEGFVMSSSMWKTLSQ